MSDFVMKTVWNVEGKHEILRFYFLGVCLTQGKNVV